MGALHCKAFKQLLEMLFLCAVFFMQTKQAQQKLAPTIQFKVWYSICISCIISCLFVFVYFCYLDNVFVSKILSLVSLVRSNRTGLFEHSANFTLLERQRAYHYLQHSCNRAYKAPTRAAHFFLAVCKEEIEKIQSSRLCLQSSARNFARGF